MFLVLQPSTLVSVNALFPESLSFPQMSALLCEVILVSVASCMQVRQAEAFALVDMFQRSRFRGRRDAGR
jgi:hypothetical protein